ncbi:MAG TPA: hypothetical protein VK928_11965 [Longimicrobiales bacterium]|nr:hypothetical protein [Longimicrobiales bacterium]
MSERVFLLSPASCAGRRAALLFGGRGAFPLALHLAGGGTVPLGEAFAWLSGLYFRGKLAYARTFASPPTGVADALVITTNRGLVSAEVPVSAEDLRAFGAVPIDTEDPRYREPLERDAHALAAQVGDDGVVVLLGSVASGKYVDVLLDVFGERLHFPREFVGRGDMSRGGLMLRCVESGEELDYVPVAGAVRRGARPPKLEPRRWT